MNPFIRRILFASLVSGAALGTVPPVRTAPPSHAGPPPAAAAIAVTGLRCEYAVSPMGIDVPRPRLYWRVQSPERGARQTAWRVLVSSSPEFLAADRGDLWDSGRVASDESAHIPYAGSPLASSQRVYWKVRAWDQAGRPSAWSLPATWTMGLLRAEDWKGAWIAAPGETETLLLRGTFDVRPGLVRAVAHASGLGHYELTLNGRRVGEDLFAPGWTNYARTVLYDTHDVTALLTTGRNAAGFLLGNGMYHVVRRNRFAKFTGSFGPLRAILHLRLEYADGSVEYAGTNAGWRSHPGPITYSSVYGGEDYDARLEPRGWSTAAFDDRGWSPVVPVIGLEHAMRGLSAAADPIRPIAERPCVSSRAFPDKTVVYDFGQNAAFVPRLRVAGPAGSTVRLTPSEILFPDGTIDRRTMGSEARGVSWWQYTKATDGEETWVPSFYYVGSRYVRAEFFGPGGAPVLATTEDEQARQRRVAPDSPLAPTIVSLDAVIVHSSAQPAGRFEASDPLLNRIRDLVRWAQRSNMVSVLTDCPHREKLGWLEQYHLNGPAIRYEFDTSRIFTKGMNDMADSQTADGLVPDIAPEYTVFEGAFRNAAEWGAAFILVPWQQYLFNGDVALMRTHYDAMKRYAAFLESRARNGILSDGLGDWYDLDLDKPGGAANLTPAPITATAYYWLDVVTLARIAGVLGKPDDERMFREKAAAIRARYLDEFHRPAEPGYATGSQAALAIPLALGLADSSTEAGVLAALVRDVEARGYATAGDVGFRSLLQALAQRGRSDVVYRLVTQDTKPGYAFQLRKGATALTEAWDADRESSHNHFMMGHVTEWLYQDLAGITADERAPGFKHIVVRPQPVPGLDWVEASYESIRGPIAVRWEQAPGAFTLRVAIPANTTATVHLPARGPDGVTESGTPAAASQGVSFVSFAGGRAVYRIESGRYAFESRW
ncbi:MAG TPA: family 78 glycoside hydrolase catalytic domain [Vicinamibacterales bacterium]|nr:family 78 glycoside hydrolase catalytic domain [Vicinamibacterales bacterium]HPW19983.1 family 78 glycoside hydrolase catalytic domain [Vicinamibacterales bacterium]